MANNMLVRNLTFQGQGKFTVTKDGVDCDRAMDVVTKGAHSLLFKGEPSAGDTNITFGNVIVGTGSWCSSTSGTSVSMRNGETHITTGVRGHFFLNGHRYRPYVLPRKTVYVPEGFQIVEQSSEQICDANVQSSANDDDEKKKHYRWPEGALVIRIEASGQALIIVDPSVVDKEEDLVIILSGQSSLEFSSQLTVLTVSSDTSGQSTLKGPINADDVTIVTCGQSTTKSVFAKSRLDATSSGQSTIKVSASATASVSKDRSGQSTLLVQRV